MIPSMISPTARTKLLCLGGAALLNLDRGPDEWLEHAPPTGDQRAVILHTSTLLTTGIERAEHRYVELAELVPQGSSADEVA